ncbi:hypothetical protein MHU86_25754 [Fragilaria crotonensis]|nr:hypothetical protein MHU86_25754 [Fragilaria crotonensis]
MIQAEDSGETRMAPNAISYNSVLHACAKAGEDIMARKTLLRMTSRYQEKRSSVQPDIISFNTLLNAYSYSPRAKAAHDAEKSLTGWKKWRRLRDCKYVRMLTLHIRH